MATPLTFLKIFCIVTGLCRLYALDPPSTCLTSDVGTGTLLGSSLLQGKSALQEKLPENLSEKLQKSEDTLPKLQGTTKNDACWESSLARVKPFTMVSDERIRFMYEAVEKVNKLGIEGDLVEAGVWKGGTSMMMVMAQFNTARTGLDRQSWLYDTFEGLPAAPSEHDDPREKANHTDPQNGSLSQETERVNRIEDGKRNYGREESVQRNMFLTGFPTDKIHFVSGKVEDTLKAPSNLPEKIAILRLDTNGYSSTKAELKYLLPRLQPGGLLFIDGYCAGKASRAAADEMLDMHAMRLVRKGHFCAHAWKPL